MYLQCKTNVCFIYLKWYSSQFFFSRLSKFENPLQLQPCLLIKIVKRVAQYRVDWRIGLMQITKVDPEVLQVKLSILNLEQAICVRPMFTSLKHTYFFHIWLFYCQQVVIFTFPCFKWHRKVYFIVLSHKER